MLSISSCTSDEVNKNEKVQKKTGYFASIINMILGALGLGLLSMGGNFRDTGIALGVFYLSLAGFLSHVGCLFMADVIQEQEARGNKIQGPQDVALIAFPKGSRVAYWTVLVVSLCDLILTAVSTLIFATQSFQIFSILQEEELTSTTPTRQDWGTAFPFFLGGTVLVSVAGLFRSILSLKRFFFFRIAWIATLSLLIIIIIQLTSSYILIAEVGSEYTAAFWTVEESIKAIQAFGSYIFAYALCVVFPFVKQAMKEPERASSASVITHGGIFCIYALVGISLLVAFGRDQQGTFFENREFLLLRSRAIAYTGAVILLFAMVPKFFIYIFPVFESLEYLLKYRRHWQRALVQVLSIFAIGLFSYAARDHVGNLINVTGSVTTSSLCFIFPPLLYYLTFRGGISEAKIEDPLSRRRLGLALLLLIVGLFALISGLVLAIQSIVIG